MGSVVKVGDGCRLGDATVRSLRHFSCSVRRRPVFGPVLHRVITDDARITHLYWAVAAAGPVLAAWARRSSAALICASSSASSFSRWGMSDRLRVSSASSSACSARWMGVGEGMKEGGEWIWNGERGVGHQNRCGNVRQQRGR